MRALLPALLITFLGCAESTRDEVATTKQAVVLFPSDAGARAKGANPLAHLGATLTSCPGGGWVAGAPGDDSIYWSSRNTRMRSSRPLFVPVDPMPVACIGQSVSQRVLMGGPNNTYVLFPDGGNLSVYTQRADSFDVSAGYLALGDTLFGTVRIYSNAMTATALTNPFTTANIANMGNSVSWGERGDLLVGNVAMRNAIIYSPSATGDGGTLGPFVTLQNPEPSVTGTDFGKVVLIGDFSTEAGEEYVVSAPAIGRVYIFSGSGLVGTLPGGPSFGAALAKEPEVSAQGIHALWIGEPAANRVHRYLGGMGLTFPAPAEAADSGFGAAIALDVRGGLIAIGAPLYSESVNLEVGAVFEASFDAGINSTTGPCILAMPCVATGCVIGTCVTNLVCLPSAPNRTACAVGEVCMNDVCTLVPFDAGLPDSGIVRMDAGIDLDAGEELDAGIPIDAGSLDAGPIDAGTPDAGTPDAGPPDAGGEDAGTPDAGERDAGQPDAGRFDAGMESADAGEPEVMTFHTCGCTSADVPLLLLALALWRRRVTAKK